MKLRLIAALFVGVALVGFTPQTTRAACHAVPRTPNTPTGIAGCETWGSGTASWYGSTGSGVAMNYCTWGLRHTEGCGRVRVTSLQTHRSVVVPVVDFCDCYTGTARQRIADLQPGVVVALGLERAQGLYPVTVEPISGQEGRTSSSSVQLPNPAFGVHVNHVEVIHGMWWRHWLSQL